MIQRFVQLNTKMPILFLGTTQYTVYQIFYFKSIHLGREILEFFYQEILHAYLREVEKDHEKKY